MLNILKEFYKKKKVLVTGNTGFKGSWLCEVLILLEAEVVGYALQPEEQLCLFHQLDLGSRMKNYYGDIRDREQLIKVVQKEKPEIIIHMAAQPIVRESYKNPAYTYEVNVMGTVNILEAIRQIDTVKSVINVTTDKVYKNKEWYWGYRENEELNGFDPYSNSKSCSELVTESYKNSFFIGKNIAITTMRAGNVIGGGDYAKDRIIPDCVRAASRGEEIKLRNPYAIRPYQHVLEPVIAYLIIAMQQYEKVNLAGAYNIGPEERDFVNTKELTELFCKVWEKYTQASVKWRIYTEEGPHESNLLKLDCSKIKSELGWKPKWGIEEAVDNTIQVYLEFYNKERIQSIIQEQIKKYLKKSKKI